MIKLDSFNLVNYDDNFEYVKKELESGKSKSNFIHSVVERLQMSKNNSSLFNNAYIVLKNNEPIGYLYISGTTFDEVYIEYSILYNNRNNGYASLLLTEISDFLFFNYNIRSIKLDISPSNKASINVALKSGFYIDDDELEKNDNIVKMIFIKDNLNYENKRKNKF